MPIRLPFCYIMPILTTYTASDRRFSCLFATYAASDCRFSRLSAARAASDWRFRCFLLPRMHLIGDLNSLLLLMLLLIANSAASFLLCHICLPTQLPCCCFCLFPSPSSMPPFIAHSIAYIIPPQAGIITPGGGRAVPPALRAQQCLTQDATIVV